jgi:hypothetical protein
MTGVLMVAATLLSVCTAGPVCPPAPARVGERGVARPLHDGTTAPQAGAPSRRPTRLCSIGHRLPREAGAPPVWFRFDPQMRSLTLGRAETVRQKPRARVRGGSRAPPSTVLGA